METQNKNNFANVIGLIIILVIAFTVFYFFFFGNVKNMENNEPESSGQSMENAPVINDPLEREAIRTQDRPDFGSGIKDLE